MTASISAASPTAVTIIDHLSTGQQEETIAVFLAGRLVGTLHVDPVHPDDRFELSLDGPARVHYTLCGLLRRREADGSLSDHRIDNGGELDVLGGGVYAAMTLDDRLFALVDPSSTSAPHDLTPGPACSAAVS